MVEILKYLNWNESVKHPVIIKSQNCVLFLHREAVGAGDGGGGESDVAFCPIFSWL